jgi:HAD domain in Swiss Army Knife RNA repair proteins
MRRKQPTSLRPRPGSEAPPATLLCIDIDGVINALPRVARPGQVFVEVFWIDVDRPVIRELDRLVNQSPGLNTELAWLTTWGSSVEYLQRAFRGRLGGGYVVAERPQGRYTSMGWKVTALTNYLAERGNPAYVWAEDEVIPLAIANHAGFAEGLVSAGGDRRLLVQPDPEVGLTLDDVELIRAFVEEQR